MSGEELSAQKKTLRRMMRERLDGLDDAAREAIGEAAAAALVSSALWTKAESVFCYRGVRREPDTRIILARALSDGKRLYLPRCIPDRDGEMEAVRVGALDEIKRQPSGLWEPIGEETARPQEIALALLPCLAATPQGARLGHGGGYYDRFLAEFCGTSVIFAPEAAVIAEIPTGCHDRAADWLLTERGLRACRGNSR
jgi:5-formyltetrahydrofolate cyclo-ligase